MTTVRVKNSRCTDFMKVVRSQDEGCASCAIMVIMPGRLCGDGHLELALGPQESLSPSKCQHMLYVTGEQEKREQPQLEEQGLVGHLWWLDKRDKKWVILLCISQKTWKLYQVGCVVLEEYP